MRRKNSGGLGFGRRFGGDIAAVYHAGRAGDHAVGQDFFADEYRMNAAIAEYPKPYVVIMNGITMGGGVGISAHGSHRIVTDSTKVGMPETGIGLFPDVGGTYLLARAPGELGTHLALTGTAVGPGAAIALGLVDHYVPEDDIADLITDLESGGDVETVIARYAAEPPESELAEAAAWIDECYRGDDAEAIVAALAAHASPEANAAAELILTKAPTSVKVTLAAIRLRHAGERQLDVLAASFPRGLAAGGAGDGVAHGRSPRSDGVDGSSWMLRRA